jgi:hypothetical protein
LYNNKPFANKTLRNNVVKFFTNPAYEYHLCFFSEIFQLSLYVAKDGGAYSLIGNIDCFEGWGVVILNVGELLSTVVNSLKVLIEDRLTAVYISEEMTFYVDNSQIDERVVLEYDGLVGGKEYLAFEGIKDLRFNTIRNYFSNTKKVRKPISFTGVCQQKIETRFKDMANAEYLKSLLIAEDVKKLEASYATPTPVTLTTENVKIGESEMFTNQLDMEYEY